MEGNVKDLLLSAEDIVDSFFSSLRRLEEANYDRERKSIPIVDYSNKAKDLQQKALGELYLIKNRLNAPYLIGGVERAKTGNKVVENYLVCIKLHGLLFQIGMVAKQKKEDYIPSQLKPQQAASRIKFLLGNVIAKRLEESFQLIDGISSLP